MTGDPVPGDGGPALPCADPVIVLTGARSGSTLLRFILDSHPDLACPPETNVLTAVVDLARTWNVLEAAATRRSASTAAGIALPPQAVAAIRQVIDGAYGTYLSREGKQRWCDKSLPNALYADLFCQIYPRTQFICLYRNCMDFILSALEACPWGVSGFGFEPFVAHYPGNNVAALGKYWVEKVRAISSLERKYPDRCHRIRYEDLAADPEPVIQSTFDFLGVRRVPGISRACFGIEHASNGLGDHKIWFTDRIGTASVGRGGRIPVGKLPEDLREDIGQALSELGYEPLGGGRTPPPGPVRAQPLMAAGHEPDGSGRLGEVAAQIRSRVTATGSAAREFIVDRWPALEGSRMRIVVRSPDGRDSEISWTFGAEDLSFPEPGSFPARDPNGTDDSSATLEGDAETWRCLLGGTANMASELLTGRLLIRHADGVPLWARSALTQATAMLLGLTPTPGQRLTTV
jgi:protein-tyrosine sulfotransferase